MFGRATITLGIGPHFSLNCSAVAMVDEVKYIGVYFERKSGQCDISQAFIKFYSQFSDIVAVMGKNSNELTTLPTCEICNLSDRSMHKLNVAWNNCFRYFCRYLEDSGDKLSS